MRRRLRKKLVYKILIERTQKPINFFNFPYHNVRERFNWPLYYDAIDQRGMNAVDAIEATRRMWKRQWENNEPFSRRFHKGKIAIGWRPTPESSGMVRGVPYLSNIIEYINRLQDKAHRNKKLFDDLSEACKRGALAGEALRNKLVDMGSRQPNQRAVVFSTPTQFETLDESSN